MVSVLKGLGLGCACAALFFSGCGGDEKDQSTGKPSETARAAALSLQQAMDRASRSIDQVRRTRSSVERLGVSLQPTVAQTSDVIVLLTPKAASEGPESALLTAARQQRSFLQFSSDATRSQSRRAANSALARAQAAGARASVSYARVAREDNALAGLVPAATTFNTGRLRDAVRSVTRRSTSTSTASKQEAGSTAPAPAPSSCGDGVSVNSVTSCPFGRSVKDAYEASGGASVIEAYSPVTGTTYTMTCSSGIPTVCRGGNNAVVTIR